ncbi:MAG: GNAT family N-acetyltransferase [Sphingobacteriales bacterium]|nr:MAG: GNAT family N-acetyltransferase [Sphingobacteriales bacterium]
MEHVDILKATSGDIASLLQISRQTFLETFAEHNTTENIQKYLEDSLSEKSLTEELNNIHSEFHFAVSNQRIIGYLKLNYGPAQTDLKDEKSLEIERIYVLKEYHGQQVGRLLFQHSLERAKKANAQYIWLGVWEKNLKAIAFYKKIGFVAFDTHVFMLGDDKQKDILMKLML